MTDSTTPQGNTDPNADRDSTPSHDSGNPAPHTAQSGDAGIDRVPSGSEDASDGEQNAPLPDWGPTDGTHGVDGADPED